MRNVLNSKNMLGFLGLKLQLTYKTNKIIQILVTIKYNSTKMTLSLPSSRNYLVVTIRPDKGGEKSIKIKGIKKRGKESLPLLPERKGCLYFLKTKTTSSYKLTYFKGNKLYKIQLYIFFSMLVENIEFKVTKITYIHVMTIS